MAAMPEGDCERTHTTFKLRHTFLQYGVGGVHDARVDVALYLQVKQVRTVLGVVERVGGGLVDGRGRGVGCRIAVEASVKGESFPVSWLSIPFIKRCC